MKVIYGHVMTPFVPTQIYQRKREFARQILAIFNSEHFKPVRIYFFKSKTDFIGEWGNVGEGEGLVYWLTN